ncbi:MAG: MBL fold metallo-hydrolase [Myxococcota bacterium]|nr:MBL fold metallo-hydrolase [Myxococcota bacterium]
MIFQQLFHRETSTYTYLLADEGTHQALFIDPVLDELDTYEELLEHHGLKLTYTLETHVHADHITAAGLLRERYGSQTVVGRESKIPCADILASEGDSISLGDFELSVVETPGHTNTCISYVCKKERLVFTGDALLINGCGRTDFQSGDPAALFQSVHQKLFSLPDETQVYPGHDYQGRKVTTIANERANNERLGGDRSLEEFVDIMNNLNLPQPKAIHEAVPANQRCGIRGSVVTPTGTEASDVWAPVFRSEVNVPEVTAQWVLDNPKAARLVDVREPDEFTGVLGHIEGSELIPKAEAVDALSGEPKDSPIVLICRSGRRSGIVALELEEKGFSKIVSMQGGLLAVNEIASKEDN